MVLLFEAAGKPITSIGEYLRLQALLADDLASLDATAIARVLALLDDMRGVVMGRIAQAPETAGRLDAIYQRHLKNEIDDAIDRWRDAARVVATDGVISAGNIAKGQIDIYSDLAIAMGTPNALIDFGPVGLLDDQIAAAAQHTASLIGDTAASAKTAINQSVIRAVFGANTIDQSAKEIAALLSTSGVKVGRVASSARTILRTEMMTIYNVAADHAIRHSAEELPGIKKRWLAFPGAEKLCIALSNKIVGPKETFTGGFSAPPRHPNCRCRIIAWMPHWPVMAQDNMNAAQIKRMETVPVWKPTQPVELTPERLVGVNQSDPSYRMKRGVKYRELRSLYGDALPTGTNAELATDYTDWVRARRNR